jgi:MFS-type transporter involved in bile tolerance (Atg22 family)
LAALSGHIDHRGAHTPGHADIGNFEGVPVVCVGIGIFYRIRSCLMRRMKPLFVGDDQIDAILPVAGTLAALIVLLVVLVAQAI